MYNSSKLVDGAALNSTNGFSLTTGWVDVREIEAFSCSVVFTGGTPTGNLVMQQSNDRQFTGGNQVKPLSAAGAENSVGAVKILSDAAPVPSGNGAVSVSVAAAGTFLLDQRLCPFGWFRIVYTATSNVVTQLDIFTTIKNYQ